MREILDRLDRWLSAHRPDFAARLAPGVEIPASFGAVSDAARAWFRWHDGERGPADGAGLVLGWRLLGWEDSLAAAALAARDPHALEGDWHPGWLPILGRSNGDLIVLDTGAFFGEPEAVVEYLHGTSTRVVHAPSLDVWLDALVETLEDDAWAPDPDGVWVPTGADTDLWNSLVLEPEGYPSRVDPSWEGAPWRPRPLEWRDAFAHAFAESAVEALWFGAPRGDVALDHQLGAPLDAALARIDAAPADRRAGELARLAAVLRAEAHPRAGEIGLRCVACADPFGALDALAYVDLTDGALRAELVARTAAWMRARTAGSVAWSLLLADALAPLDAPAAAEVRGWNGRLRSGRASLTSERLILSAATARTDPAGAAALVEAVLPEAPSWVFNDDRDAFTVRAAVRAAVLTGRVDALLRHWTGRDDRRCFAAVEALVREGQAARAAAVPDEVSTPWLGDALALHVANLTGRAPDARAQRALETDRDGEFEYVLDASVHGAVCDARARHYLRTGDRAAAHEVRARHLGALQRAQAEALAGALARVPEESPGVRVEGAEEALAALRPWSELTPDPFALTALRRLLPKVLQTDATAAAPLRVALREAAQRIAAGV
jgi:cell wall assembly regulator SMI1